ncbi:unnamed protein product [Allacma fusca]|uniref:Uncharacterized protein n=1 Tax=Allacma fusca TaxID=39272 RepID=A0A8J2J4S4_9HEXA|nr:unnamed protein product [Allacma fusca]
MSYSSAAKNEIFPSADQAIIFPFIDGVPIQYYARKMIGKIGNNILHCAKISNNRVRMYLRSREIADKFLKSGGEIEIDRKLIKGRWYKQERNDKKIIISNVPPHVPHNEIINIIISHGITPSSKMKFLHLSQEEDLTDILSERRFVYILPAEDANKLPSSELIKHNDEEYRVFYNDSIIKCFVCHQFGHTSQSCEFYVAPTQVQETNLQPTDLSQKPTLTITDVTAEESSSQKLSPEETVKDNEKSPINSDEINSSNTNQINTEYAEKMDISQTPIKRPLSTSTLSQDEQLSQTMSASNEMKTTPNLEKKKKKRKIKKVKLDEPEPISINQLLESIEDNFDKKKMHYPLSFTNFRLLMEMVKGQQDPYPSVTHLGT